MAKGLLIAAPASGSGKTVVTLALLRHFRDAGVAVSSIKAGPDYIDPAFHTAASGRACFNLDSWAMRSGTLAEHAGLAAQNADVVLGEGVMGLFDGAVSGGGSTADLAALTGWPVVLVVDARGMGASAAALVSGFITYRRDITVAGVIFNRVGSPIHRRMLMDACDGLGVAVLGCLPRDDALTLPERHLGLVQAQENENLEGFLATAAGIVADHVDTDALAGLAMPRTLGRNQSSPSIPPLGQRIAVARDAAFAFSYPVVLDGWRRAGSEVSPFSPLADEPPAEDADAVYLPGGYPELYASQLAANQAFLDGLRNAAGRGAFVYGECGGYMVLGNSLTDATGEAWAMAGLLPLETSFAEPRLRLGYRQLRTLVDSPLGPKGTAFRGHEFHYAKAVAEHGPDCLFQSQNSEETDLGSAGLVRRRTAGSFVHLIDRFDGDPG
ncbi:MAG: cobyrinate a,c-diamide synthase [Hyphomicrobiales bacterium]|nr:cobyrinate a,c-diamide synthase [Hyphomicrobiales bacterium]